MAKKGFNPNSDAEQSLGRAGRRWKEVHATRLVDEEAEVAVKDVANAVEELRDFTERLNTKADAGEVSTSFGEVNDALAGVNTSLGEVNGTLAGHGTALAGHSEALDEIDGVLTSLGEAVAGKAPTGHTHAVTTSDVGGLADALAGKAPLAGSVFTAQMTKTGTNFALTVAGLPTPLPGLVTVCCVATADYVKGDTTTINGAAVTLVTSGQKALPANAWKASDGVTLLWNTAGGSAFFKAGGGGGAGLAVYTPDNPPEAGAAGLSVQTVTGVAAVIVDDALEVHVPGNTDGVPQGGSWPGSWTNGAGRFAAGARPNSAVVGIDGRVVVLGGSYTTVGGGPTSIL